MKAKAISSVKDILDLLRINNGFIEKDHTSDYSINKMISSVYKVIR